MHREFIQSGTSSMSIEALFDAAVRLILKNEFAIVEQDRPNSIKAKRGKIIQMMPATQESLSTDLYLHFRQEDDKVHFDIQLNMVQFGSALGLKKVLSSLENEVVSMRDHLANIQS